MFGFAKEKKEMPLSVVMYFRSLEKREADMDLANIKTATVGYADALHYNNIVTVALTVVVGAALLTANFLNA